MYAKILYHRSFVIHPLVCSINGQFSSVFAQDAGIPSREQATPAIVPLWEQLLFPSASEYRTNCCIWAGHVTLDGGSPVGMPLRNHVIVVCIHHALLLRHGTVRGSDADPVFVNALHLSWASASVFHRMSVSCCVVPPPSSCWSFVLAFRTDRLGFSEPVEPGSLRV